VVAYENLKGKDQSVIHKSGRDRLRELLITELIQKGFHNAGRN